MPVAGGSEEGEAVRNCLLAPFFATHFLFLADARRNPSETVDFRYQTRIKRVPQFGDTFILLL